MTREEFKTLVKGMKAVYAQPTFIPDQDAFNVWFELLKDIPYQQANVAIQKYMLTEKFPPTIADIREKATQIVESVDSSMSELEAWSLVRKAVRNSGYHSVEEFEKLPEACQRAVGSAANLKEWALMDSERVETVEQSHFIRNYRTTVQRISEEKKLPESIRLLIASMRDNALELEKKEQPVLEVKKQEEEKTDPEPGMSEETRAKFQQCQASSKHHVAQYCSVYDAAAFFFPVSNSFFLLIVQIVQNTCRLRFKDRSLLSEFCDYLRHHSQAAHTTNRFFYHFCSVLLILYIHYFLSSIFFSKSSSPSVAFTNASAHAAPIHSLIPVETPTIKHTSIASENILLFFFIYFLPPL